MGIAAPNLRSQANASDGVKVISYQIFPERTTLREIRYKLYVFEPKGLVEISEKSSPGGNITAQVF
jgi:hypothetical protein